MNWGLNFTTMTNPCWRCLRHEVDPDSIGLCDGCLEELRALEESYP